MFNNDVDYIGAACYTGLRDFQERIGAYMAVITTSVVTDERSWQNNFYDAIFGADKDEYLRMDRSTDGYTDGILFEHKLNVTSYGRSKALSQALIYLSRFNRDGVPVPAKICLVSQDEQKCYIYDTADYMAWVEDIEAYANMKASDGIIGFTAGKPVQTIDFDKNLTARGLAAINAFISRPPQTVKVHITEHNVYGWSGYYYSHAEQYKQKPEKKAFFKELRDPVGTLKNCIEPWTGNESDFKYIMDMLNDPMTQKKLGAFYTPPQYAELAAGLVEKAIQRALGTGKKDYIILDRCAGTGNLEMYFDDDILSHVIVSTYELKEWMVLKDRFGNRVRYIIPPIPAKSGDLPALNTEGFLSGANALTRDIIDNPVVRQYVDDPECAIIMYENPPYVETSSIDFHRDDDAKKKAAGAGAWKATDVASRMAAAIGGVALNDICNAFIWSGFEDFKPDSYIIFSPIKYYKIQHLIHKMFAGGFAFNKKHFHAYPSCVTCIWWLNEDVPDCNFYLKAYDIDDNGHIVRDTGIINGLTNDDGDVLVRIIDSLPSEKFYDKRPFAAFSVDGITCDMNGTEAGNKPLRIDKIFSDDMVGYLISKAGTTANARQTAGLTVAGKYDGNGFFLHADNFMEKLPLFVAARYSEHFTDWKTSAMVMKSGDGADRYEADVTAGKLDEFLFKTMFWTCLSHYPHMRSLNGSDGRLYINQLCFDGDTLARRKMDEYIAAGHTLTDTEQILFDKMQAILEWVKSNCKDEYNLDYRYGLYQIDEEINVKTVVGVNADGTDKIGFKYGDLNNMVKELKALVKQYYIDNLVDTLFEYEFLK